MIRLPQGSHKVAFFTTRFTRSKTKFRFQRPAWRPSPFQKIAVRKSGAACEVQRAAAERESRSGRRTIIDFLCFCVAFFAKQRHKKDYRMTAATRGDDRSEQRRALPTRNCSLPSRTLRTGGQLPPAAFSLAALVNRFFNSSIEVKPRKVLVWLSSSLAS